MPEPVRIILTKGVTYWQHGSYWHCLRSTKDSADVVNVKSGWRCTVHDPVVYPDTHIAWSHSTDGRFDDAAKLRAEIAELERLHGALEGAALDCHCIPQDAKAALSETLTALHNTRWNKTWTLCAMLKEVPQDV